MSALPSSGCRSAPSTPSWPPRTPWAGRRSFAVCNADDVYGEVGHGHAGRPAPVVGRRARPGRLRARTPRWPPTTRSPGGSARWGPTGCWSPSTSAAQVHTDGRPTASCPTTATSPGSWPATLPASVNLWGFQSDIWKVFHSAMDALGPRRGGPPRRGGGRGRGPEGRGPAARGHLDDGGRRGRSARPGAHHRRQARRCHPRRRPARSSAPSWPARWPGACGRPTSGPGSAERSRLPADGPHDGPPLRPTRNPLLRRRLLRLPRGANWRPARERRRGW